MAADEDPNETDDEDEANEMPKQDAAKLTQHQKLEVAPSTNGELNALMNTKGESPF